MKLDSLNRWLTLFANVGVIAGIFFLAIQVQQNNKLLSAAAINVVLETRMQRVEQTAANEDQAALLVKNRSGAPLTEIESARMQAIHARTLMGWQRDFFLFQEGILTEDQVLANLQTMKNWFSRQGESYSLLDEWERGWKNNATAAYRFFIEQCVLSDCEAIPR